jgi:molybdopterin-containing oxidoreductase family membrane subunit
MSLAPALARIQARVLATQKRPSALHVLLIVLAAALAAVGGYSWSLFIRFGLGYSGLNRPVGWGVLITNFVFWVGIGHAGTLLSAILFLFRAKFRTAVYRAAEIMTVFAVMTAGLLVLTHMGRPWFAYWLVPYPNQRHLWVNFRSPLLWDVFAISTYLTVSSVFLVIGIVPDAAALRDASAGLRKRFYALLAFGWRGTDQEWRDYTRAYGLFATLASPLVVSVHSVVSWDFAMSQVPGWHSTIFPPYFVAGAIFSGVGMVITLLIPMRKVLGVEELITPKHLDMLARLLLFTSLIVAYSYALEFVLAFKAPPSAERATLIYRATGHYAPHFWTMVACNCVFPLFLFSKRVRAHQGLLLVISILVNVGMWLERFNIIVTSLAHDRSPFVERLYHPRPAEYGVMVGSFGLFFFLFLLSLRFLPAVSIAEMKEEAAHDAHEADHDH